MITLPAAEEKAAARARTELIKGSASTGSVLGIGEAPTTTPALLGRAGETSS